MRDIQHRNERHGLDCSRFKCLRVMGMASVSWIYLFNIQVRANCTTACNIQAALRYVELTHISSSVSFFLYLFSFTKKCACSLEQVPKSCRPRLFPGGRGLWAKLRMRIGVCVLTDQSDWLLSHSQRCTREIVSDPCSFFVCLIISKE